MEVAKNMSQYHILWELDPAAPSVSLHWLRLTALAASLPGIATLLRANH